MSFSKTSLQTSFVTESLPHYTPPTFPNGLHVDVQSPTITEARQLISDMLTALDYGAYPAMLEMLIHRINEAEDQQYPLACTFEFLS